MAWHRLPTGSHNAQAANQSHEAKKVRRNWVKTRQHHAKFGRGGEVVKQGHCASLPYGAPCLGSPSAVTAYVAA